MENNFMNGYNTKLFHSSDIDIVIPWVDGTDREWRAKKETYSLGTCEDGGEERYRDWELLAYWFRGIERFAPWVRKIFFVTDGQLPEWLNTGHPKLYIVKHKDFIPEQFLPTFNANVIELHFHKISGLAENFIYFNDDMFLLRPVKPENFFRNGKPCDMLALQPVVANYNNPVMSNIFLNNSLVLSKYFRKWENMHRQPGGYFHIGYPLKNFVYNLLETAFPLFTGFYTVHGPSPLCKSTYEIIWKKEQELLEKVSAHRIRNCGDVNQYLLREWKKLSGEFCPTNLEASFRYFNLGETNPELERTISRQSKSIICINDAPGLHRIEDIKAGLHTAFESILSDKSGFEKAD